MVYHPVTTLDAVKTAKARETIVELFHIPSLREYQEKAGQNVLLGKNTFLDIPTGGGKTLSFYYPLFYHWQPGVKARKSQKIILVIGPFKWAHEIAGSGLEKELKAFGNGDYRVGFVGPEMALNNRFHELVLENRKFQASIISAVIDESHNISEWGTDDFRPDFGRISALLGRLPLGLPILAASATVAPEVITHIQDKLGIGGRCEHIAVSNEKPNVSLAVRIMQHPPDSYADLLTLFPKNPTSADDFAQTLIYVNSRQEAEHIQDFLREHAPEHINGARFEFYHRYIADDRKTYVEDAIASGFLRAVSATDALGMGMDFRRIKRVYFWMPPRTFNSLIQKLGRCVRVFTELGEAVLLITRTAFSRFAVEFDVDSREMDEGDPNLDFDEEPEWEERTYEIPEEDSDVEGENNAEGATLESVELQDGDVDMSDGSDSEPATPEPEALPSTEGPPSKRRRVKRKKVLTRIEARDRWYLLWFILTTKCRRIPWNRFYNNASKQPSPFPKPDGAICCDNCDPSKFHPDTIKLTDPDQLRLPGRQRKSPPDLFDAVKQRLEELRDEIVLTLYGTRQGLITGCYIMQDDVVQTLAERARAIDSTHAIKQRVWWHWVDRYGQNVVEAIQEVLPRFPDQNQLAKDAQMRERALKALLGMAKRDLREKISKISEACFAAVESHRRTADDPTQVCQLFKHLPRKNRYPDYYEQIANPISMANIRSNVKRGTIYTSVTHYSNDWHLMFSNARQYNMDGSQIYEDANALEDIFEMALCEAIHIHGIVLEEDGFEEDDFVISID
ncbi:hypothetical protein BT96DRAFT_1023009 [Gymnopus androsaceus JB14]|uniref:DNA 3'-5' helicase n=1 Tax=Gymnopus androsaceus JB14 TaxID=1447944 RepID=A0A6A4H6W3_9AGAR|nr:hypothetical protein BT96DRAFT_1023009 [Gymnopus androsaceus JB14]